jgi:hypothetical protein
MQMYDNDANLDPATWILFELFQKAGGSAQSKCFLSSKACLKKHKKRYRAAIKVLAWLEFAIPDAKNALGCQPTSKLMTLIAQKPNHFLKSQRTTQAREQRDAIEALTEAALKRDALEEDLKEYVINVLGVLGLVRYNARSGRAIPTSQLSSLIAERRLRDRKERFAKLRTPATHRLETSDVHVQASSGSE